MKLDMVNYLEKEYTYSSSNTASMKNLYEKATKEEKDLLNDICKIPYVKNEQKHDLHYNLNLNEIESILDGIKDEKTKSNVFTLFFVNYLCDSRLLPVYNHETTKIFNLINNKYNLNMDYIDLIDMNLFSNKLDYEKTNSLTNIFSQSVMKNKNLEQLDFMLKTFDNNEIKEYFNNYIFQFRENFIYNISTFKEFFNKLVELELIDPNSIKYKDYLYIKNSLNENEIKNTTLLNSLCIFKPLNVDKNALDTFKYLYSEGYDLNDSMIITNYYQKLIKSIDESYLNLKVNKYNLEAFIKEVPKIYDSISKNKNLTLEEKGFEMMKKNEEVNNLIKKYDDVIKTGKLKKTRLENIELNKEKKSLENIREL